MFFQSGDLGADHLVIEGIEAAAARNPLRRYKRPAPLQALNQLIVIGKNAGMFKTQCLHDRASEGRQVDDEISA